MRRQASSARYLAVGFQSLILCRGGHIPWDRQVSKKIFNFFFAHRSQVTLLMEKNVAPDPIQVSPFCTEGVIFSPQNLTRFLY